MIKSLKKIYHQIKGDYLQIKPEVQLRYQWYGSKYGGFFVHPDILGSNSIVYSFGIGEDITFDETIISKHNCQVFGFDPTPRSINWIEKQKLPNRFTFYPFGIDTISGEREFFLPKNEEHVSGSVVENGNINLARKVSVKMKTFQDIVTEHNHAKVDLVKMDIEGLEYNILPSILKENIKIGQILVEFHHRMLSGGKSLTLNTIKLLQENGYLIFAVSENSEEVSFIKRELLSTPNGTR